MLTPDQRNGHANGVETDHLSLVRRKPNFARTDALTVVREGDIMANRCWSMAAMNVAAGALAAPPLTLDGEMESAFARG